MSDNKFEEWFAVVTGFKLKEGKTKNKEEMVLSNPEAAKVLIRWFHTTEEISGYLSKDSQIHKVQMIQLALEKGQYLLATKIHPVSLETINCEWPMGFFSKPKSDVAIRCCEVQRHNLLLSNMHL